MTTDSFDNALRARFLQSRKVLLHVAEGLVVGLGTPLDQWLVTYADTQNKPPVRDFGNCSGRGGHRDRVSRPDIRDSGGN